MKSAELIIGNYYQASIEFRGSMEARIDFLEKRIFRLTKETLILILQLNLEELIFPIPLDEDLLLKMGFTKVVIENTLPCYILDDLKIFLFCNGNFEIEGASCMYEVKYLHQLQIISFALKQKELTIMKKAKV